MLVLVNSLYSRGQALILIAIGLIGLVGMVALAVDGGNYFRNRRNAQNAADAGAIVAVYARISSQNFTNAAVAMAASNGYDNNGTTSTVMVNNPPRSDCSGANGPYAGNNEYFQVIINTNLDTFFAPVVGVSQVHNCVEAISRAKPGTYSAIYNGNAVVGLAPNACDAIQFHGNSQLQLWGSGMFSNSNLDCGLRFNGNPQVKLYDGGIRMVASGYTLSGSPQLSIKGGIQGGAAQYPYPPPESMLPSITCTGPATQSGSSINPGNWTGDFPPNGVETLQPGTYCVNGDFSLQGSGGKLTGNGVTIYMQSGGIKWNGNAEVKLSAPTSGAYKGLLIYAPTANTSEAKINGNSNSLLTGLILMPGTPIDFNGNGQLQKSYVQVVGYTVDLGGTADLQMVYRDADNWDTINPPTIEIAE